MDSLGKPFTSIHDRRALKSSSPEMFGLSKINIDILYCRRRICNHCHCILPITIDFTVTLA